MRTAHTHPAHLTPEQEQLVAADGLWARACRDVWNVGLEERLSALQAAKGRKQPSGWWPTYASQCKGLSASKADAAWLKEAPSHALQQTLKDLDRAWAAWLFHRAAARPRWRAYKRAARNFWLPSYRFPDRTQFTITRLNRRWGQVRLPKIGAVRFRWTRNIPKAGIVTNVTLKQDRTGGWQVVFAIDLPDVEVAHPHPGSVVGIDVGVTTTVVTSDSEHANLGATLTCGGRERLRRLEHKKARQQPGSANRHKIRTKIARLRQRQANGRAEFAHQTSRRLADRYQTVAVEDLHIPGMVASASGTVDRPGVNVAAKRGLNRQIVDKGWGQLQDFLGYKTARTGGTLVRVPPAYTSVTCHVCGTVDSNSRENQAEFCCTGCGHRCHADVNAAHNIRARAAALGSGTAARAPAVGRTVAACGDLQPLGGSTKQEPPARHTHAA